MKLINKTIFLAFTIVSTAVVAQMPSKPTWMQIGNQVASVFENNLFNNYDDIIIGDNAAIKKIDLTTYKKIGQFKPNGPMKYVFIKKNASYKVDEKALQTIPLKYHIRIISPNEQPIKGKDLYVAEFIKDGKKYRIFYKS